MHKLIRKVTAIILLFTTSMSLIFTLHAESLYSNNDSHDEFTLSEEKEKEESSNYIEDETNETTREKLFIEETSEGFDINDYEREKLKKYFSEESDLKEEAETCDTTNVLESALADIISENIKDSKEDATASISEIEREDTASISEVDEAKAVNRLGDDLFAAGNHSSTASPSVVINATYDRHEIYTGENEGVVRIFDNDGVYYDGNTNVSIIKPMVDEHNNSPILLNLDNDVQFFNFDRGNNNYVLIPEGFIEYLVANYSGNGYLNPQGIDALDHITVDVTFNGSNLGKYDLFEYGVLYYLSCYEGVLGEYYYYDPNTTDINKAASFYVNNRIMDRTYNIVSEYFYKAPSGEQLSFKPSWVINNDNLQGASKEEYVRQWVSFPYFLIKAGEKYWNLRDSIEQSTYLSEYAEGYYEQYLTEAPYGNVGERLTILDNIYKDEESLLNDTMSTMTVHPYVRSSDIEITGNYREDTINDANKLRAGGVLPYDTYAVLNLNVIDHRAKSVQVYLNGDKLVTNSNHGLYTLTNGKCQIRVDGSKLINEEDIRNVLSFILLDEEGNYLADAQGRVVNNYISLIRDNSISKESHRVHFIVNGGNNIPDMSVEEGNKLSLPSNPIKEYYTFLGWYKDSDYSEKFDENEYIIGDLDLYALWRESDIDDLDILGAAARCINERVNGTNHNISSNYSYKNASGDTAIFRSNWEINNSNLTNGNRENYVKQWINFPYFLIKTGEKYWEERNTYNGIESMQGRLLNLDGIYKTEASLLSDTISGNHPYKRSNSIVVTGNLRSDVFNDTNKMRSGASVPYGVNTILNVKVSERSARTLQVWINGDKLTSDNSNGLYMLKDGTCQVGIAASKLIEEENSRNVVSFLLLDETGRYLTDASGRLITNYISIIRNANINKISYKVSFYAYDGSNINDINVIEGNRLSLPTNPTRYNYEFKGWYTDVERENKFDENEYIIADKTLYALWGQVTRRSTGGSGGGGGGGGSAVALNNAK